MSKFEVFKSLGLYYFRFKASNGLQILSSESYESKQSCLIGIASVRNHAPYDSYYHRTNSPSNYRFNMVAANNQIIARSSEGYVTEAGRENAIAIVKRDAPTAPTNDLT